MNFTRNSKPRSSSSILPQSRLIEVLSLSEVKYELFINSCSPLEARLSHLFWLIFSGLVLRLVNIEAGRALQGGRRWWRYSLVTHLHQVKGHWALEVSSRPDLEENVGDRPDTGPVESYCNHYSLSLLSFIHLVSVGKIIRIPGGSNLNVLRVLRARRWDESEILVVFPSARPHMIILRCGAVWCSHLGDGLAGLGVVCNISTNSRQHWSPLVREVFVL